MIQNPSFDAVLADKLGDLCSVLLQLDKIYDRYANCGELMVRMPYWTFTSVYENVSNELLLMDPINPPNDYIQSSLGKYILTVILVKIKKKNFSFKRIL